MAFVQTLTVNSNLSSRLDLLINNEIAIHPSLNHPLFDYLENCASKNALSERQFELFRHIMFGRVYLTIPSITDALKSAILRFDKNSIKTCYKNLSEELASENGFISHVELMESAFNLTANCIFSLPPTTLRESFNNPRLAEELIYRYTTQSLYSEAPLEASFAQELSSGGLNDILAPGMMASLFKVFKAIFLTNQNLLPEYKFRECVLPYFQAHLSISENYDICFDAMGVEFHHGQDAKNNFGNSLRDENDLNKRKPYVFAFLETQRILFDRTLEFMEINACL